MKGIYLTANYPNKQHFLQSVELVVSNNFDFLEIGIPFSEPVADGSVIANAYHSVLKSNTKISEIFDTVKQVINRYKGKIDIYVMTYGNIVFDFGIKSFSNMFLNKLKGIIIADCPCKMQSFFYQRGLKIPIIPFITPESRKEDFAILKNKNFPFVYCIGIRGITGSSMSNSNELKQLIQTAKTYTKKPIILGFGIKSKKDTEFALSIADGFVVGTAALKKQQNLDLFNKFLLEIT
jgi:tryptophan synthase alpha chain